MPSFHPASCRKTHWTEHLIRLIFGGAVTAATGVIAERWGPGVGGLFLAFPAILPASLTLLKEHDGRRAAVQAARGARLGALALIGFAGVVAALADTGALFSLAAATLAWAALAFFLWKARYGKYARRRQAEPTTPR